MSENLAGLGFQDKREALKALQIQVTVAEDRIDIQGVVPVSISSIGQTSECLPFHAYVAAIQYESTRY